MTDLRQKSVLNILLSQLLYCYDGVLIYLFIYLLIEVRYREKISIRISSAEYITTSPYNKQKDAFGQIRVSWQVRRQAKGNTHVTISYKPVRIQNPHKHTYH